MIIQEFSGNTITFKNPEIFFQTIQLPSINNIKTRHSVQPLEADNPTSHPQQLQLAHSSPVTP